VSVWWCDGVMARAPGPQTDWADAWVCPATLTHGGTPMHSRTHPLARTRTRIRTLTHAGSCCCCCCRPSLDWSPPRQQRRHPASACRRSQTPPLAACCGTIATAT
jgi:hypothetical protein